jgi:predicted ATPase
LAPGAENLAAALRTIIEIGDEDGLHEAVELGFPGSTLFVEAERGRFELKMAMPGMFRPFEAHELSDGTLRYLCLTAALLSPRPPSLLAFNEPESSLHPGLLEPLARLLVRASEQSQVWITTHSTELAHFIKRFSGCPLVELERVNGETRLVE